MMSYERMTMKVSWIVRKSIGKLCKNTKLLNKIFRKRDVKNAANAARNPGSFETKTQIPPEDGYDFNYHNLVCPLSDFARQYGYEAYMPYLCNLDYVMFGVLGVPLFREHTCFEDGDFCDFKIKIGEKPMESWPPVFTQGRGVQIKMKPDYKNWMPEGMLKKGGVFAIHDLMSRQRYGDMSAFIQKLKAEGYKEVRLIDTTDGMFMGHKEAAWLGLSGSTLLVGRK